MSNFRPLSDGDLDRLGDEQLLAYVVAARDGGDAPAAKRAASILAYGFEGTIRYKVATKVPRGAVDEVVMEVLESVIRSSFDGKTLVGFRAFLNTIIQRRIADFHRGEERRPDQDPLWSEHDGEEDGGGWDQVSDADATDLIDLLDVVDRLTAERNPLHQLIIRLYAPDPIGEALSAAEVVERVAEERDGEVVSANNVQQVWRRFKVDLEGELDWEEHGGDTDD